MQVGTYPTRNFATLGPSSFVTARRSLASEEDKNHCGPRHFCSALHVAMQLGLYHRVGIESARVWRVVSEDSNRVQGFEDMLLGVLALTAVVHASPEAKQLSDPFGGLVLTLKEQLEHLSECSKVSFLLSR